MNADSSPPPFRRDWAFFLDVDGTLLDYAPRPGDVAVDETLRSLLHGLIDHAGGAVALVSGRAVSDLERLFQPLPVALSGQHGVERIDARGRRHTHPVPEAGLRAAARELSSLAANHEGLVFEDKGLNLAMHYRLAPGLGAEIERAMRRLAGPLGSQFEVQGGKMLWEIKPSGRDKGLSLRDFMGEPPFAGRIPVAIGDDVTDEALIEAANALGGDSIKVGPGASNALYRLPDPPAVRRWLQSWMEWMRRGAPR